MKRVGVFVAAVTVVAAGFAVASTGSASGSDTRRRGEGAATAPRNPYLADSGVPIGHVDSAQTTSTPIAGPTGPSGDLGADDLTYQHLGPGHFGIAISPEYPDGERVIWSNGGDRISKLDADSLAVLSELALPGKALQTPAQADAELEVLDREQGEALGNAAVTLASTYLQGLAGVYYALDADNTLYVGGATSIIAYGDDGRDRSSPVTVQREWAKPPDVGGNFVGVNMMFDGHLVLVTDEGWVVAVTRDFASYDAIQIAGAEDAAAHNAEVRGAGARPGAADFVRNSVAVDRDGGVFVASYDHLHKVVWDGRALSTDRRDGAWSAPYLDGTGNGSGATPALMGFGDDDRLVVITDGEPLMNVVAFWRDGVPKGWKRLPGAPSRRIAGQLPADMGDPGLQAIQTEQSVVVGGNGALVVNNDPASIPPGFPAVGVRCPRGLCRDGSRVHPPRAAEVRVGRTPARAARGVGEPPAHLGERGAGGVARLRHRLHGRCARRAVGGRGHRLGDRPVAVPLGDRVGPLQHRVLGHEPRPGRARRAHDPVRDRPLRPGTGRRAVERAPQPLNELY